MFSLTSKTRFASRTVIGALLSGVVAFSAQAYTLRYATGTDAQTLDPAFVADIPTSRVVTQIHQTLIYPNAAGELEGLLAESWEVSEDNLEWTFRLRQGVTFHDGTPFNAEAVRFSFERIMDPANASPRASSAAAIAAVEVVDEHTVRIRTHEPYAPLLAQLSAYNLSIVSPATAGAINSDYSAAPSGTGPFRLGEWQPGERLQVVRNESYWGEPAAPEAVDFIVVPEDSARVLMLMSGEADVISNVPTAMVPRLTGAPGVEISQVTGYRTIYVGFNFDIEPLGDIRVRQAIAHAINYEALVAGVMGGLATLGGGLESTVIPGSLELPPYEYNPARSRELLAEAGLPDGFEIDFYTTTGRYVNDRQLSEAIQAQLAEVGIRVNLQSPEFGSYTAMLRERNRIPMFLLGKGSPTGDPDFTLTINVGSEGSGNYGNYVSPAIDALLLAQRATVDLTERQGMIGEILQTAYDDYPWVTLFYENQLFGQRDNVDGLIILPNENVLFHSTVVE